MFTLLGDYLIYKTVQSGAKATMGIFEILIYIVAGIALAMLAIPTIPIFLILYFFFGKEDYLPKKHKYSMYKLRDKLSSYLWPYIIFVACMMLFMAILPKNLMPENIVRIIIGIYIFFVILDFYLVFRFLLKYGTAIKRTKKISYAMERATKETIGDLSYILTNYYYHKDESSFQESVNNVIKKFGLIFQRHIREEEYPNYKEYIIDNLETSKKIIDSEIGKGYREKDFQEILAKKLLRYTKSIEKKLYKKYKKGKTIAIDEILAEYGVMKNKTTL